MMLSSGWQRSGTFHMSPQSFKQGTGDVQAIHAVSEESHRSLLSSFWTEELSSLAPRGWSRTDGLGRHVFFSTAPANSSTRPGLLRQCLGSPRTFWRGPFRQYFETLLKSMTWSSVS